MKKSTTAVVNLIIVITLFSLTVLAIGTNNVTVASAKTAKPIYKSDSQTAVCFTFNVYQGEEYVSEIMRIFEENGYKTTFFVGGSWAKKNTELVKEMHEKGFEIGSHGYFHRDHSAMNYTENLNEINMSVELIESIIGQKPTLFAPPSGAYNDDTIKAATNLNLKVVMWSKDTIDWRDHNVELIKKRATKNLTTGDIILMHPTAETVAALKDILKCCKELGLTPTTVSEALN